MTNCLIDAPLGEASLVTFKDDRTGRTLTLRLAESPSDLLRAEALVARMYARKGYRTEGLIPEGPRYATLLLSDSEGTDLGTVTVGSGERGLRAEESYADEISSLKDMGRILCEFNALAILPGHGSAHSLARLFHAALLAGGPILGHTDGVLEVNPSHVAFYERMLGFERVGQIKSCPRVEAPSLLLSFNFAKTLEQAEKAAGKPFHSRPKSLFPLSFEKDMAKNILEKLTLRLLSPTRILRDRCIGFFPSLPEERWSVTYRSGHRPSVPA